MTNILLLPPIAINQQTITANGRTYAGTPGNSVVVPDFDAGVLVANGWTRIAPTGTTAQRPATALGHVPKGFLYADTTVGDLVIFDGATWRNISGNAV